MDNQRNSENKIRLKQKANVMKKTLKEAPFIMNDNGLNMRIKIKRKSR